MFVRAKLGKKGTEEVNAILVELIIIVLVAGLFGGFIYTITDNTLFHSTYLRKDMALMMTALATFEGKYYYTYDDPMLTKFDYEIQGTDPKVGVRQIREEVESPFAYYRYLKPKDLQVGFIHGKQAPAFTVYDKGEGVQFSLDAYDADKDTFGFKERTCDDWKDLGTVYYNVGSVDKQTMSVIAPSNVILDYDPQLRNADVILSGDFSGGDLKIVKAYYVHDKDDSKVMACHLLGLFDAEADGALLVPTTAANYDDPEIKRTLSVKDKESVYMAFEGAWDEQKVALAIFDLLGRGVS